MSAKFRPLVLLIVFFITMGGCNKVDIPIESDKNIKATDYSVLNNWLSLPNSIDYPVDIFYIYPTIWSAKEGESKISTINPMVIENRAKKIFKRQASVFETIGNIYAPYYRQLDVKFLLSQNEKVCRLKVRRF